MILKFIFEGLGFIEQAIFLLQYKQLPVFNLLVQSLVLPQRQRLNSNKEEFDGGRFKAAHDWREKKDVNFVWGRSVTT